MCTGYVIAVVGCPMSAGYGRTVDDEQWEKMADLKYRTGRCGSRFRGLRRSSSADQIPPSTEVFEALKH